MSYRRAQGMRGLGFSINPTTIWTPQTGYLATTGTLADGYQYQPQYTSVYDVPGLLLPTPTCTQSNGGAFVSQECVQQALDTQQLNFQRAADYNAGFIAHAANGPNQPPPPPAAVQTATPAGGLQPCYQPNIFKNGVCVDPFSLAPVAGAMSQTQQHPGYAAPAPPTPPVAPPTTPTLTAPGGYIDQAKDFLSTETEVGGFEIPVWAFAAAGAGLLLVMGMGGRR